MAADAPLFYGAAMPSQVSTFIMFQGEAEAAFSFYAGLFAGARLERIERFRAGEHGIAGKVREAVLLIDSHRMIAFDSAVQHSFKPTPSISLLVAAESTEEIERLAAGLAEGGEVLMPLDSYDFATRYAWVTDRFGISWQLCFERK